MPAARRTAARIIAATLLALGPVTLLGPPAQAATAQQDGQDQQEGQDAPETGARVTWGAVPAGEEGADGRVSFRLELEPGAEHTDFIEISNFSEQSVTFGLTASDGVIVESGEFDLLPDSQQPAGTGAWIEIAESVEIDPDSSAVLPYTLRVPEDALPGDHPGGIAVSVLTAGEDDQGNSMALNARVGVRVHLRVPGELTPRVEVTEASAEYRHSWNPFRPGTVEVTYTAANTGNVRLGSDQSVTVTGLFGIGTGADGRPASQQREILPGQSSGPYRLTADSWPLGRLTAEITAEQQVVGEDVIEAAIADARARATVLAVPWPQLVYGGGLLALAAALLRRRRRLRRRLRAAEAAAAAAGKALGGQPEASGEAGEAGEDRAAAPAGEPPVEPGSTPETGAETGRAASDRAARH